jgi:putative membrane protein
MKQYFSLFVKGFSMGAANVIPGVSGGTIALITGIYNELISTLKSFNLKALKLLFKFKFKEFFNQINLAFLIVLFAGAITGIVSLGKFFKWVIELERDFNGNVIKHGYEPVLFALFFGLILASVYYVGVTIKKWNFSTIISGLIGCIIAVLLVLVKPSSESDDYLYLFLCGIVAMSSMLLPGLSGSFVLILMGNYYLIMIDSVQNFDIKILGVVCIGAVVGFVILSHLISYLLQKHEDVTLSSLTGFIFGSLVTIWPWKTILREEIVKGDKIKEVIVGYENWFFPEFSSFDLLLILFVFIGFFMVFGFERLGNYLKSKTVKN